MQPTQSSRTVKSLQLTRDELKREVNELKREYYLYMSMLQQTTEEELEELEEKPGVNGDSKAFKLSNESYGELQLLREEHDRLSSEILYLQRELTMLKEENSDLYDSVEVITREKVQIENQLHETREALELSKNSIDFFMAEREGFIKEKETKMKMIRTFEALFSMISICILYHTYA